MKQKRNLFLNIISLSGYLFVLNNLIYFLLTYNNPNAEVYAKPFLVILIVQFIVGCLITVLNLKTTKKAYHFFMGLMLCVFGIISFLISFVYPRTVLQWWPVYTCFAGVILFFTGLYKYRRIKFGYFVFSLVLIGMGIWYSLFSFDVIKIEFSLVASTLGPLFLILLAAFLVAMFAVQQKHKELIIDDDDTGVFSDETEESLRSD